METTESSTRALVTALTVGLIVFLAGGLYFWNESRNLAASNGRAERRADSLQLVKARLETDIEQLDNQLATAKVDNTDLSQRVEEASRRLSRTDATLRELRRSNAGRTATIGNLNRNISQLTVVRDSLTAQMDAMRDKISYQAQSNEQLTIQNNELQKRVTELDTRVLTMVPRSVVTGDAFRVEAVKSNEKVTAKAKKVDALSIFLNVPAELRLEGMQEVYLSLTDERRQAIMPPLQTSTITLSSVNEVVPVHAVQNLNFAKNPQRITFRLEPGMDIKPGLYRASVYTKDAYLGSVEFQLRDSFWFF